ncbi:MAG: BMP family ABC transporter substrate-binding protein [Desulfamplus sp.]|nr:BMP family ABC transporter substrate-binding protein [Desulfamplus sp.]
MKKWILIIIFFLSIPATSNAKTPTIGFMTGLVRGSTINDPYNSITSSGLFKIQREYKFNVLTQRPDNNDIKSIEKAFQNLIDQNADLIVCSGYQFSEPGKKIAKRYPQTLFIMNDAGLVNNLPNVSAPNFAQHEGSFLVGALAGKITKTGKVGFIGGVDVPPLRAFLIGYQEGVHYSNANVEVTHVFITNAPDYSGFTSPEKGRSMAKKMYGQDVDIIYNAASLSGNGVIQEAKNQKKFVIGVDYNQDAMAKGYVLTSMLKRLDISTYKEVKDYLDGNFQSGSKVYGLKDGGISLTEMIFTRHIIPVTVREYLKDIESKIISGEIKITDYLMNH